MSRPNLVLDANGKGLGLLLEHTGLCGQGLCWPTELTGEVGQAQQQPCEAARADSSTQWVRGAGRGRTGLMNSPRQGWSHRLCVKGDFITSEEGIREREAGSSRLKPEDQAWHSGPWKEWQVEKPWTHPAVWRVSVPRCDPVPSMSFTTRKQAEHVVHTTRTGQNCGLNGVSFAPVGDSRQHL